MKKQTRSLLLAVAAVLVILVVAFWYWRIKDTVKLAVSGITSADGAVALAVTTTSKSDPTAWVGKKIKVHTKSLGTFRSTVAAATSTTVRLPANAVNPAAYVPDKDDCARVTLKH